MRECIRYKIKQILDRNQIFFFHKQVFLLGIIYFCDPATKWMIWSDLKASKRLNDSKTYAKSCRMHTEIWQKKFMRFGE